MYKKMAQIRSKQISDFKSTVDNWAAATNAQIANASDIYSLVSDGDLALSDSVDSLESALSAEISETNADVTSLEDALSVEIAATDADVTSLNTALSAEISATNSDVTSLEDALSAEIAATDADVTSIDNRVISVENSISTILDGSDVDLDQFAEIVTFVNSIDVVNDGLLSDFISVANQSVDSLESALSVEISETNADVTSLEDALSAEIAATDADVTAINASIDSIELALTNSGVTDDDFVKQTFTGITTASGSATTLTVTGGDIANYNSVHVYVNGLFAEATGVSLTSVSINPGYAIESGDTIVVKYVTE
jgi:hypothetical protein